MLETIAGGLVSGSLIAFVGGVILQRRTGQIQHYFETRMVDYQSRREWKQQAVTELLGPAVMELDRTSRAFDRWTARNLYIEAKIIKEGNEKVRHLLLSKGYLLPPELLPHAARLVEHYDRWLEEYERVRGGDEPDLNEPFVFVGPQGYPFPREDEKRLRQCFQEFWTDLYGSEGGQPEA